jgi:hypothetical protein
MRLRRHFLRFQPKDSRAVKGRLGGGLVFRWAFAQRPLDFDGGVHGGQQDYGRGGVDDGLAEVEGSSSVMVAISRCLPHTLPSTLATVASSLAYWIPIGRAAASIRVIHPLRVMLLHPGPRYHLIVTWSRAATGHVRVGGSPMEGYPPIAEHGLIGDLQTAALVTTDGTVDWFCCPRFDSPSVFASLLVSIQVLADPRPVAGTVALR